MAFAKKISHYFSLLGRHSPPLWAGYCKTPEQRPKRASEEHYQNLKKPLRITIGAKYQLAKNDRSYKKFSQRLFIPA